MKRRQFLKSLLGFTLAVPVVNAKEERKPKNLDLDTSKQKWNMWRINRNDKATLMVKGDPNTQYISFAIEPVGDKWNGQFKSIKP